MKKRTMTTLAVVAIIPFLMGNEGGCGRKPSSDTVQRRQQETLLQEGTAQVGMPAIKNFRERKLLKDILELRDQTGLVTYTYVENMVPTIAKGVTARGGKFTFFCDSIGYPIPYATQFTNPEKLAWDLSHDSATLPQADPNGLFSPASAEGTWVMCKDGKSDKFGVVYAEPKLTAFPFKLELDE